jgi:hypothetical protein
MRPRISTYTNSEGVEYTKIEYSNCREKRKYNKYDDINDSYVNSCLDLSIALPSEMAVRILSLFKNSRD